MNYGRKSKQRGQWEFLIPAAASVIGSIFSSEGQQASQESANVTNINLNQANRDWMTQMSNTAYQRATADMQAAGLNPMLAYAQGGASVPSNTAPVVQPVIGAGQTVGNAIGAGVSGAQQGVNVVSGLQDILKNKAATEQLDAQTEKIKSETMSRDLNTARATADLLHAEGANTKQIEEILTARYGAQTAQMIFRAMMGQEELKGTGFAADVERRKAEARLAQLEIPRSQAEADFYKSSVGHASPYIKALFDMIMGVSSAKRAFSPAKTVHQSTFEVIK